MSILRRNPNREPAQEAPLDVIDPALSKFYRWVDNNEQKFKQLAIVVGIVLVGISVAFAFIPFIPQFVHVVFGVPLGLGLFFVSLGHLHLYNKKKLQENPQYLNLKEKYTPANRLRMSIIAFVVFIVISITIGVSYLPNVAGGALALAALLGFYNFVRRTHDEVVMEMNGEEDPRNIVAEEEAVEDDEPVASEEETQAYVELVNSLPEEQRRILLNPNLNGALAVVEEDDKKKKKRKLFGK